jgi:hypothetical protein
MSRAARTVQLQPITVSQDAHDFSEHLIVADAFGAAIREARMRGDLCLIARHEAASSKQELERLERRSV